MLRPLLGTSPSGEVRGSPRDDLSYYRDIMLNIPPEEPLEWELQERGGLYYCTGPGKRCLCPSPLLEILAEEGGKRHLPEAARRERP